MPCWFYEKADLDLTPSSKDSIDGATEARYRREGARFIIEAGTSLNLGYDTMATGVVYFHRFYMKHSFKEFPRYLTGVACLFLAGKVEETPKKCKDIIRVAKELLPQHHFAAFGDDPKEEIMTYERILLQTIKFDLQVEHPYSYLLKYAKSFKGDKDKIQKLVQMAWTFVNDSLCTTLCLQWEPHITAVAFLYLAGRLSKSDLLDWSGKSNKVKWWEQLSEDVSLDIMEEVCHQLLDLYAAGKNKPSPSTPSKAVKKKSSSADGEKSKDEPKVKSLKKSANSSTPPPPPSVKFSSKETSKEKQQTQPSGEGPSTSYQSAHPQVIDPIIQAAAAPQLVPQAPVPPIIPPMVSYGTPPPSQGPGYGSYSAPVPASYPTGSNQSSFQASTYGTNFMGGQADSKDQPSYEQKQYDQSQYTTPAPSFSNTQQNSGQSQPFADQFSNQFGGTHNFHLPPPALPNQQTPTPGGAHSSGLAQVMGSHPPPMKPQVPGIPPHPLLPQNLQQPVHPGSLPPHLQIVGSSNSPVGATSYQQTSSAMGGGFGGAPQQNIGSGPRPLMSMPLNQQSGMTGMATVRITGRQFPQQPGTNKPGGWNI